jgi:hypothetical protein
MLQLTFRTPVFGPIAFILDHGVLLLITTTTATAANFPEPEQGVVVVSEDRDPVDRVEEALQCLTPYDPSARFTSADDKNPFLYWKIRDFAYAYRSGITTPSAVS